MSDRTINFGESESEATYQIQDTDSTGGGNFVVAKDTNANTVLLQYDPDTDTWEYAGDVDMNGGNVSGVGTLTAESVNTDALRVGGADSEDHRDGQHKQSEGGEITFGPFNVDRERIIVVEIHQYRTDGSSSAELQMSVEGDGSGSYASLLMDETGSKKTVTGVDHWVLFEPTAGAGDFFSGRFYIDLWAERVSVYGNGSEARRGEGFVFQRSLSSESVRANDPEFELYLEGGDGAQELAATAYQTNDRSEL